jgi:hypothetical protein
MVLYTIRSVLYMVRSVRYLVRSVRTDKQKMNFSPYI